MGAAQLSQESPLPTCLLRMAGKLVLVVHWGLSLGCGFGALIPVQAGLSVGCLGLLSVWWAGFQEPVSQGKEGEVHFYDLASRSHSATLPTRVCGPGQSQTPTQIQEEETWTVLLDGQVAGF